MSFFELALVAVGLSMDAFAAAVCAGLTMKKAVLKSALIVGLYFGVFQALMPLIGYFAATRFADTIASYGRPIAFALLCLLGGKLIIESFKKEKKSGGEPAAEKRCDRDNDAKPPLSPARMLPLAVATSVDALAAGASLALLEVNIAPASALIGMTTFVISMAGVKIGNVFGTKFRSRAELAGGVILALIGLRILLFQS